MSSTSNISRSRALAVLAVLLLWVGVAQAGGRKRIVVLDFEGENAEKIHEGVVKLLKKSHTVISSDKWNAKAEELGATKVTEKNVKKVAKKLKLDGVITGKVDKRRDEYIVKLKLRSGTTGEILGNSIQTKADGTKLDAQAQRDIKDELLPAIDELESNRDGGGDEEEEAPTEKAAPEDEEKPKKSGFSRKDKEEDTVAKEEEKKEEKKDDKAEKRKKAEEEKAALATKKEEEEAKAEEEEKREAKKEEKKPRKRKASVEEDGTTEDGVEESAEVNNSNKALNVSPSRRAIDAVVGLSFTARRLDFKYSADLGKPPPGYKQSIPVAGALLDMTFYPLSFSHKPNGIISGIGLEVLYDQVLKINSQKRYADGNGMQQVADLATSENRWEVAGVLRYPLGTSARSIVVGGKLSYGKQKFTVEQTIPNSGMPAQKTDIPNVAYTMLSPTVFIQAPVAAKIILNADASFHAVTDTGAIQQPDQYGAATVTGYELNVGADYLLMTNIFIRAGVRYEGIGFTFKGDPMSMTHTRDTDATDQDVQGAKDSYFGGFATLGYLY